MSINRDAFGLELPRIPVREHGPRLTFATDARSDGTWLLIDVDRNAPGDPRDRAICRALLTHALRLLDEADREQP
ncbi:hypothetical protein [Streptomyces griseosporeus]|uniref:hypothetical protein n=1 Tax=Streptomyces griseosporeus TaxID=1910 RepID=UPI0036FA71F4